MVSCDALKGLFYNMCRVTDGLQQLIMFPQVLLYVAECFFGRVEVRTVRREE